MEIKDLQQNNIYVFTTKLYEVVGKYLGEEDGALTLVDVHITIKDGRKITDEFMLLDVDKIIDIKKN